MKTEHKKALLSLAIILAVLVRVIWNERTHAYQKAVERMSKEVAIKVKADGPHVITWPEPPSKGASTNKTPLKSNVSERGGKANDIAPAEMSLGDKIGGAIKLSYAQGLSDGLRLAENKLNGIYLTNGMSDAFFSFEMDKRIIPPKPQRWTDSTPTNSPICVGTNSISDDQPAR